MRQPPTHLPVLSGKTCLILMAWVLTLGLAVVTVAETGTEFSGTVLKVDQVTGKVAVKKEGGGTRFTFVANEKTTFQGADLASLKDLKKDDEVTVRYLVQGSSYLALSITRHR